MIRGHRWESGWWFSVFGYGVGMVDHRVVPQYFSERNGFVRRIHIGSYCFKWMRPLRPKKPRLKLVR